MYIKMTVGSPTIRNGAMVWQNAEAENLSLFQQQYEQ